MSLTHIPTTLTNGKWVLCPDKWNCMIFIENSQVIFKGSFHLQNQILLLIIPSISSSLAKWQIEAGTKQKQNSIDSIEPGIKISWKRMILWFGDKCYDTGYNAELLLLPGLMSRWFSFFSAQDSTPCSWQRRRTTTHAEDQSSTHVTAILYHLFWSSSLLSLPTIVLTLEQSKLAKKVKMSLWCIFRSAHLLFSITSAITVK